MKRSIRPSTSADAPAILALFDEADFHPNSKPHELQWKYWQPRSDWPGPRSFVLTSGSELIAHGATLPTSCVWGHHRINMIQVIDWVARRGEPGAGVALMKWIGQQTQALLSVAGGARTLAILPHLGFRAAGVVTAYVRTLFPLRLLRTRTIPPWLRWPRFVRSVVWTVAAPAARSADWRAYRIAGVDIKRIVSVLPLPAQGMATLERSMELFRYMLSCPIVPMALYSMERSQRSHGYFLLASAPGQVRIADCWMDSADPADWRAMILCAVRQAREDPQAAEVVAWANEPLLAAALQACGFHPRFEVPVHLRLAEGVSMPSERLRVQMLDNDTAYLHSGEKVYWA